jgi:fructosamine-3-kinase
MLSGPLASALKDVLDSDVQSAARVSGGDLNDAWSVELEDGRRLFVKTRAGAGAGEYATEAEGLAWLAEPASLGIPEVVAVGDPDDPNASGPRFLALQWIDEGGSAPGGSEALGRGLALLHQAGAPSFGGPRPLRLGPLTLPNDPLPDWPRFYAERRLLPLVGPAVDNGSLSQAGAAAVERVAERMSELAGPAEPPARLHGDLWSGNVMWGADGRPWLVDPAAYGGHREVDLAMLRLFGAPGAGLFAAYEDVAPLPAGHEERVELWQLFPLLVHAVLFGGGYGGSVQRVAERYA